MTECEWLAGQEPQPMLEFLYSKASKRKLRLFACNCCRRIWNMLTDERSRNAVEVAEKNADGFLGVKELRRAGRIARILNNEPTYLYVSQRSLAAAAAANAAAKCSFTAAFAMPETALVVECLGRTERSNFPVPHTT